MPAPTLAAASALAGGAFLAWAVRGRSASVFGPSVWHGDGARRALALTFDDGPSEGTPFILDLLAQYCAPATFFQIGANVERLPAIAREVAERGHAIGNHSYTHPLFCFRSPAFLASDLGRAQQAIESRTGVRPVWFRAPFGVRWFGMRGVQRELGLTGVMWSAIGRDWKWSSGAVAGYLEKHASNGGILCLHDGRERAVKPDIGVTVEALRRLLPALLERGYRLETIDRLLCPTS